MTGDPKLHEIAGNRLLRGVGSEIVERIRELAESASFASDEIVFHEGDSADYLYLILEGRVRISKQGRAGAQENLAILETQDFFGEMAIYDPAPRSGRATAAAPTRLARLDRQGFEQLLEAAPVEVSANLTQVMIERLRRTDTRIIQDLMEAERLSLIGSMASSIIHDFKNPVGVIQGTANLLEKQLADPELHKFSRLIQQGVDQMLSLMRELLDYSRGTAQLSPEPVPIDALLEELHEQSLSHLAANGIVVEKTISYRGDLLIDRSRFLRVLLNLVANAAEAMPEGGMLKLDVVQRGPVVAISVGDTGPGVPEELLPQVFEPFVTHGKKMGTGLGLAIARSIVEAHGGSLRVTSTPGEGATFTVVIPAVPADVS